MTKRPRHTRESGTGGVSCAAPSAEVARAWSIGLDVHTGKPCILLGVAHALIMQLNSLYCVEYQLAHMVRGELREADSCVEAC